MAEETTVRRQLIRFETDDRAANEVRQRAQELQRELDALRISAQDQNRELGAAERNLAQYGTGAQRLGRRIDRLAGDLRLTRQEIEQTDRALDEMVEPRQMQVDMGDIERARHEIEQARLYGYVKRRTRAIGRAVRAVGGTELAGPLNIGAELLSVNEAAGMLRHELPELVDGLNLTRTNVALLAGGVTALGAGIVLAYNAIRDAREREREEAQRNIELLTSRAEGYATGIKLTTDELDEAVEAQERRVAILEVERDNFAEVLDLEEQYNALLDQQAGIEQQIATVAQMGRMEDIPKLERQLAGVEGSIAALTELAGVSEISGELFDQAREKIEVYNDQIEELNRGTEGLTEAYDSELVAANDAAAASRELAQARMETTQQLREDSQQRVQWEMEISRLMRDASAEQVQARIDDLALQRDILASEREFLQMREDLYGEDTSERVGELTEQIGALDQQVADLTDNVLPFAEQAEQANQALEDATTLAKREADLRRRVADMSQEQIDIRLREIEVEREITTELLRTLEAIGAAPEALREVREKIEALDMEARELQTFPNTLAVEREIQEATRRALEYAETQREIQADRQLKLQREEEDFLRKRAQDWNKHYRDLAKLDQKYFERRSKILADMAADARKIAQERLDDIQAYNLRSKRLAEDHQDNLLRMQRDANRSAQEAVASLNAWALRNVRIQLEDQTGDANKEYEKQQERREEDFEHQMELLDRERDERLAAGRQALEDLRRQHQRERQEAQRAFQDRIRQEDQERRIRLQRQQQDWAIEDQRRRMHFQIQQGMTAQHYTILTQITQQGMSSVQAAFSSAFGSLSQQAAAVQPPTYNYTTANVYGDVYGAAAETSRAIASGAQSVYDTLRGVFGFSGGAVG